MGLVFVSIAMKTTHLSVLFASFSFSLLTLPGLAAADSTTAAAPAPPPPSTVAVAPAPAAPVADDLRPKIGAEKSKVLNFYWMLVGLITGVYTFGLVGVLLGPIVIGLLKAIVDTVSATTWRLLDDEEAPRPADTPA